MENGLMNGIEKQQLVMVSRVSSEDEKSREQKQETGYKQTLTR